MKKLFFIILLLLSLFSCKSSRESCTEDLVDNQGYKYQDACRECDDMADTAQ